MKMTLKSTVSILLLLAMTICMFTGAFAVDDSIVIATAVSAERDFTKEELEELEKSNAIIDQYIANKLADGLSNLRSVSPMYAYVNLPVTPIQQWDGYTCGPATALMVANYFGVSYTHSQIESIVGYSYPAGTNSEAWKNGVNNYVLPAAGVSQRYQWCTMSSYSLWSSIVYSIDNGFPLMPTVYDMPAYNAYHFILVNGYYWDFGGIEIVNYCDPHWNSNYFGSHSMTRAQMDTACSSNAGYFVRLQP